MNGVAVRSLENSRGPFAIFRRTFLVSNNSNILLIKCENTTSENRSWVSRKLQISSTNRTLCPWSEYTLNRKRRFIIQLKWCISLMFRRLYSMYTWLAFRLCSPPCANVWRKCRTGWCVGPSDNWIQSNKNHFFCVCVCIVCSKTPRLRAWILTTCEDKICQLSLLYI